MFLMRSKYLGPSGSEEVVDAEKRSCDGVHGVTVLEVGGTRSIHSVVSQYQCLEVDSGSCW